MHLIDMWTLVITHSEYIGYIKLFEQDRGVICFLSLSTDYQFPIEISSVKRDHDFLDKDLVEPLCR